MAHCSFVEVNDATRRQRPAIIHFDDDFFIHSFDQGITGVSAIMTSCPERFGADLIWIAEGVDADESTALARGSL